ncbi:PRC-barrel domain-containing protein [Pararoseomonas baculiformis]|nr:PRC-barrel domain-containing protein [Pararoseomonas baculiformis]
MSDIGPAGMTPTPAGLDSNRRLISADKVEGTAVYNRAGDRLGTIEDVMIDKISGRVAFAVMSFGGFLGMGENHHPLPWSVLTYDTAKGGYVVDLTREQLEGAPSYAAAENVDLSDTHGRRVYDYYKAQPFWLDVA